MVTWGCFFSPSAKTSIPDLSTPFAQVNTPYRNVPIAACGGADFGDLSVRFIIDEDLVNYTSIHNWIREFGLVDGRGTREDVYSDGLLEILTSHSNLNHVISFTNLFPVSLSGVPFDATVGDIDYLTADVTFKYEEYTIRDKSFNKR